MYWSPDNIKHIPRCSAAYQRRYYTMKIKDLDGNIIWRTARKKNVEWILNSNNKLVAPLTQTELQEVLSLCKPNYNKVTRIRDLPISIRLDMLRMQSALKCCESCGKIFSSKDRLVKHTTLCEGAKNKD